MTPNYTIFNKVVVFTAKMYLDKHKVEAALPDLVTKIYNAINLYTITNRFTQEEAKRAIALNEEVKVITEKPVSFIVFSLHLLKLWVDEVPKTSRNLPISDKHLKHSRALFAKDMLELKFKDKEDYDIKRQTIDDSIETAESFFNLIKERLI